MGETGRRYARKPSSGEVSAARKAGTGKTRTAAPQNGQNEPHYHPKGASAQPFRKILRDACSRRASGLGVEDSGESDTMGVYFRVLDDRLSFRLTNGIYTISL